MENNPYWIYTFYNMQVLQTADNGYSLASGGTTQSAWVGAALAGVDVPNWSGVPYLAQLQPGIFVNYHDSNVLAVETIYHEFYHLYNPSASEAPTRNAATLFMQTIGIYQSAIPGAISNTGQINQAAINASVRIFQ